MGITMGNSNLKIIRKKLAREIEDELFTLRLEFDILQETRDSFDLTLKNAKRLNRDKLIRLRNDMQNINRLFKKLKVDLSEISKIYSYGNSVIIESQGDTDEPEDIKELGIIISSSKFV